ncbi:MAG: aminotransferase class V-fold PLP-dependent enzyme [Merdibacter sp.]
MITEAVRDDFPILKREMMGHPLIYLDSGATALKPQCVIDAVSEYYAVLGANAHRGDYALSAEVDRRFEEARAAVAAFLHTADSREIVFTAGSSASLNQIASGYVRPRLKEGDVILSDVAEHASSVLPFMRAARETGARMEYIELDEHGRITMENVRKAIHDRVRFIVIAQISNVLGQIAPVQDICALAHAQGIEVIVDGAQSAPHLPVDVQQMDCDFFVSAHKLCGPTGVGVLYGKKRLLDACEPLYLGGGSNARFDACGNLQLKETPFKFESGTPPIEGVLGMKAAIDYLQALGMADIHAHEQQLRADMIAGMKQMDHVILYNEEADSGIVTFNVKNVFAQDAASWFNANGIALRSGQHCAKLLVEFLGTSATLRATYVIIRRRRSRVSQCSGNHDETANIFF